MNGILKVPMQFFILLVGVFVFVFYQFNKAPIFFNPGGQAIYKTQSADDFRAVEDEYDLLFLEKEKIYATVAESGLTEALTNQIGTLNKEEKQIRNKAKEIIKTALPLVETNDKDYVFITFIINYLPKGFIGLLLAMIFSAAMSSTASELNALGTTTSIDLYKRSLAPGKSDQHYLLMSKVWTLVWGVVAIGFACYGTLFENLIQFVNIVGSIFYGTILGIFLVGFYIKWVKGNAIFIAAIISESIVIGVYSADVVSYLMLNFIGCALVTLLSVGIQYFIYRKQKDSEI
jgi:Na+(H+)/acetate symporter ActP